MLAALGSRETDEGGAEPVEDEIIAAALRKKARSIWIRAAVLAVIMAMVPWLILG